MTVLKKPELVEYFNTVISQYENLEKSSKGNSNYSNNLMLKVLNAEKEFLLNSSDDPSLSIGLNGLPSVESLSQDIISMQESGDYNTLEEKYVENLEEKLNLSQTYSETDEKEFNKYIESRNSEIKSKTTFSIENSDKDLRLKILEAHHTKGYDELSRTTPVAYKLITTDYQVAWNNLVSKTESAFYTLEENKLIPKEETLPNLVSETKDNFSAVVSMGKKTKNFGIDVFNFLIFYPTFCRKEEDKQKKQSEDNIGAFHFSKFASTLTMLTFSPFFLNLSTYITFASVYIGTNAASGLYEWHRYEKNKSKEQKQLKAQNDSN